MDRAGVVVPLLKCLSDKHTTLDASPALDETGMPGIPALRKWSQREREFKIILGYMAVREHPGKT